MTWRLTEHEDTRPRAGGRINLIDKTLIKPLNATAKKTKFNTKSTTYSESKSEIMVSSLWKIFEIFAYVIMKFYGRMFNCLSIYRVTKNVLTLSINIYML